MQMVPAVTGHFRWPVQMAAKPTIMLVAELAMVGMTRWSPDDVALDRSTAWKYSGLFARVSHGFGVEVGMRDSHMLKRIALAITLAMVFAKTRLARGACEIK